MMVVEDRAIVEERRLRAVQVFGRHGGVEGAAAERDDAAGPIRDGKHHAVAKPIIGDRDVVSMDQQSRLGHHLDRGALARQMVA